HWVNATDISANIPGGNNGAWVTPYLIDPSDNKTLYVGYADVWKTTDRGDSWTKISELNLGSKIRAMAIAPSNNKVIYITDHDNLWKTTDGGVNWSDVTNTIPVNEEVITNIAIDAINPNVVWLTIGGFNNKGVFQSDNGGDTWIDISTGLPEVSVNTIVQNKFENSSYHLYAGTDIGVYVKDGDSNWMPFNNGLANVVVNELEIYYDNQNPTNSKLWAATYGRGLWTSNLLDFTQAAITMQSVDGPIYVSADSSAKIDVIYSANETFTSNTFNAYLSDVDGNFVNETLIGTLEADVSDTIKAIIPTNTSTSSNYKIRVKSTNPQEISLDNGSFDIILDSIAPIPEITSSISGTTSISSFNIFIAFSEEVFGFDIDSIKVTNGEVKYLDDSNAPNYKLTLIPDVNGDVMVDVPENIVSDIIGNKNKSAKWSVEFTGNTSISEFTKAGIKIYPNPNNGRFMISSKEQIKNITITDISGRKVLSKELFNTSINVDLSKYSKGIYLINININNEILQAKILVK
ncbi:MAG: T9SS type A sorting domain-containing protein, partial [Bacteroidota bacterium]|nr:T9SS type A sorting domain-containing protein [Bacteroidota bacterium]